MRDPFKALTIAVTGDFGPNRTFDKIRQWVQVNGGTFSNDVHSGVTHLICSKEHFRKNAKMVKIARQFTRIKIVAFDWLEDSLIKMRRCNEREYLMSVNIKARNKIQQKKKSIREGNVKNGMRDIEKAYKDFEKETHSGDYSIYHDHTNYKYDVTLARADLLTNTNERHLLKLYESNATPKLYACFEKHSKPGESPTARILAPIGSSFEVAFDHFKEFFKLKTGRDWDDRLRKVEPIPSAFVFALPKTGEARGVMQNDGLLMEGRGGNPVMHSTTKEPSGSTMDHTVSLVVQSGDAIVDRFE